MSKYTIPASVATHKGRSEKLFNRHGEVNASNKKELLAAIASIFEESAHGRLDLTDRRLTAAEQVAAREGIAEAMADTTGKKWAALGSDLAATIQEQTNRDGFMRHFLIEAPLQQGSIARIRMNIKNARAVYQSSAAGVMTQIVRDRFFTPPEFYIDVNLEIEELELAQSSADLLSEKYFEGLEAIMAGEDRILKKLFDQAVVLPGGNAPVTLTSAYSPTNHAELINSVNRNGLTADTVLIANDIVVDITGSTTFGTWLDPVSKLEVIRNGMLGKINGLTVMTDAHRRENLKVLNAGEVYVVGKPEQLGAFTTRGEVQAQERNGGQQQSGRPTRGWYLMEMLSETVANHKAVAKAVRI